MRNPLRCQLVLLLAALFGIAASPRAPQIERATGRIAVAAWPYFPGSVLALRVNGFAAPYHAVLLGAGRLAAAGSYEIPPGTRAGQALVVIGNAAGLASATIRIANPPPTDRALLIVASYNDGLVFHDARSFSVLGILATGGAPGDVATDARGRVVAPDTDGTTLTLTSLDPWSVAPIDGIALGDEVAIDARTRSIFVTDREVNGSGALTRVAADGHVSRIVTGNTAEGLAIDERRQIVYVANTNDGTVTAIDARSFRAVRRFEAVDRVFSLTLSPDGTRLYAISNQSATSLFAAAGSAVELSLNGNRPRVVARSSGLTFPLGAALDAATQTLFVTDEQLGVVDVLDTRTLRVKHAPLPTCNTPWKPLLDAKAGRLYVPCAGADRIDVFDARSLRRVRKAPFSTGSYPLSIAIWRPAERTLRRKTLRMLRGKK